MNNHKLTDKKFKFENENITNDINMNQADQIIRKSKIYKNRSHNGEQNKFENTNQNQHLLESRMSNRFSNIDFDQQKPQKHENLEIFEQCCAPTNSLSQITTNRLSGLNEVVQMHEIDLRLTENSLQNFVQMEQMLDQASSDKDDCYQVQVSQGPLQSQSQAQSITSKYKNILREHSQLQQTLEIKLKELKLSNMKQQQQEIAIKQMKYENNKMFSDLKSSRMVTKDTRPMQECDHFHILRIVSNKLSMLSSYITSTFNLILEINKDQNDESLIQLGKSLKDGIHVIQGLIENQSNKDSESMDLIVFANQQKLENREKKSKFKQIVNQSIKILNQKLQQKKDADFKLDEEQSQKMQKKMDQYKDQITRMKENMELFKENVKLLKDQNCDLNSKLAIKNQSPAESSHIQTLFKELRVDNESMARELQRLQEVTKKLKEKCIKYKSKNLEQDGLIQGLQEAIKAQSQMMEVQSHLMVQKTHSTKYKRDKSKEKSKEIKSRSKSPILKLNECEQKKETQLSLKPKSFMREGQFYQSHSTTNLKQDNLIRQKTLNYGTTQNTSRQHQGIEFEEINNFEWGNSFSRKRHTMDNYNTTNQNNQVISIDDQSNQITETNKENVRNDDLTQFLQDQILEPQILKNDGNLNKSSVVRAHSQLVVENHIQVPQTARFSNQNKQNKNSTLQKFEQIRSQSQCLNLTGQMTEKKNNNNNWGGSQLSRENIKQNTKVIKNEISDVDAEIQALQNSIMNESYNKPQMNTRNMLESYHSSVNNLKNSGNQKHSCYENQLLNSQMKDTRVGKQSNNSRSQNNMLLEKKGRGGSFSARDLPVQLNNNFLQASINNQNQESQSINKMQLSELHIESENGSSPLEPVAKTYQMVDDSYQLHFTIGQN